MTLEEEIKRLLVLRKARATKETPPEDLIEPDDKLHIAFTDKQVESLEEAVIRLAQEIDRLKTTD